MIKATITLIIAICISSIVNGQLCFPVKKIHAYFQPVTRGIAGKGERNNAQERGNYLIYIESSKESISLRSLWIKGTQYPVEISKVSSPVTLQFNSQPNNPYMKSAPIQLVPKTRRTVYRVNFVPGDSDSNKTALPVKFQSKALVIQVAYKQKVKYLSTDSIRVLETLGMY